MNNLSENEYVEDGFVCEAVYRYSPTLEKLKVLCNTYTKKAFLTKGMILKDLEVMAMSAVINARKDAPNGLLDKSILTRVNAKQRSYTKAIEAYAKEVLPKNLINRLYRLNDELYNYMLSCSIVAMDEGQALLYGDDIDQVMTSDIL